MLKAGSLTYALFLAIIVALICTMMIGLVHLNRLAFIRSDISFRMEDALQSGIARAMTREIDYQEKIDQTDFDAIAFNKHRHWGAFELVSSRVIASDRALQRTFITGYLPTDTTLALYQSDENNVLSLAGDAWLNGDVKTSKKGLKSAFIDGQNYKREKLVFGKEKIANKQLPDFAYDLNAYWLSYLQGKIKAQDSIHTIGYAKELNHPFWKKTLVLKSSTEILLNDGAFEGNILLISDQKVQIGRGVKLDNIVIIAPKIVVEDSVEIRAHLIATDEIRIGNSAVLDYPSSAILLHLEGREALYQQKAQSVFRGSIIHLSEIPYKNNTVHAELASGSKVMGAVYCAANLQLEGTVLGQVYTRYFLLKTQSGIHENVILNGKINRLNYPGTLLFLPFKDKGECHLASRI
ncbi:hypothetical protein [Croceimicrobium hydrocarbonivorans]|uniref:Polymer-forming cytoskeletal protein n=1 Tax=Croceimicrobium hydrocarbonivorans TaxID=2761580 RepID=A0A7H0VBX5_9FLAO|nr:hypothetical protein [Croceimicrobium hydrocarbonivorans]QNR23223.1 hypothetical protein H4K34_12665 [Croceimicrobium hydrocarbonivorans]